MQIMWGHWQLSLCERLFSLLVLLGALNPMLEDPLPGHKKTQLVLKIISGQQLPKPKDSMFGDRGEVRPKHCRHDPIFTHLTNIK